MEKVEVEELKAVRQVVEKKKKKKKKKKRRRVEVLGYYILVSSTSVGLQGVSGCEREKESRGRG